MALCRLFGTDQKFGPLNTSATEPSAIRTPAERKMELVTHSIEISYMVISDTRIVIGSINLY